MSDKPKGILKKGGSRGVGFGILSSTARQNLYQEIQQDRLHQAVYMRHLPEIIRLLNRGVSPNHVDRESGWAPLHELAARNDTVLGYRLMQCPGIDLNIKSHHERTPLHIASSFNSERFVQIILDMGADPNICDRFGQTALHYAVKSECIPIIHYLLKNKANVNAMDIFENTPLSMSLLEVRNIAVAKRLCKEGVDLSIENKKTTLHLFFECVMACNSFEEMEFVMLLLNTGIDINLRDKLTNRICLHYVAITGYLELAVVLVQKGAQIHAKDTFSRTPAEVAMDVGNTMMAEYLYVGSKPGDIMMFPPLLKIWVKTFKSKHALKKPKSNTNDT